MGKLRFVYLPAVTGPSRAYTDYGALRYAGCDAWQATCLDDLNGSPMRLF